MNYVGRFAPSPTGPLHIGSLTTAVASYLHARINAGEWLVRIEDIDPPREVAGATESILRTLEAMALEWDREIVLQSTRLDTYEAIALQLFENGSAFRCSCSRKDVREATGGGRRYPGTCRDATHHSSPTALRIRVEHDTIHFTDALQGAIDQTIAETDGDYVIFRRDGLPAYHLAVVVDDADQQVTNVVRGIDLLQSTAVHIHLQQRLNVTTPAYWHLPVLENLQGQKLSKRTGARGISSNEAPARAGDILRHLGLDPPIELRGAPPEDFWQWAIGHWSIDRLARIKTIPA